MLQANRIFSLRPTVWARIRLQLGGAIVAASIPFALRWALEVWFRGEEAAGLTSSYLGTLFAVIAGYLAFRRLSHYPGVRIANQIIPIFSVTFGLVLAVFFFFRLDYSRLQFIAGYLITLVFFYVVYFQLRRQRRLRFGIVPFGATASLLKIENIEWVQLTEADYLPQSIDGVVADLRADIPPDWERFLSDMALDGVLIMHAKQMEETMTGRVALEHLSENNFGSLIPGIIYGKAKRALDLLSSLLVLPLLFPALLLVMLAIRLESPGNAIFRQERMGFRGKPFTMYKLRSMRVDETVSADARTSAMTLDRDARITRVGRVIRRYRIDELPQVLNVIKGEMSWIGPRPEAVALSQWYESELPFYRYRHIVRPGITGWAQVQLGHVAEVDQVMEKLHYDFYYIRNFSAWLDALIVAATIRTVFGGFGAR